MASTFEKLNLKDQRKILVVNAPANFERELAALQDVAVARSAADLSEVQFSLAFVTKQREVDDLAKAIATKAKDDAIMWFAYPKGTSKKYKSEINRDHGWQTLGQLGFEPVRAVAIDENWSALRFRRVEFIKTLSRSRKRAISARGKAGARGK
jgi:hypothetical protein